MTMEKRKSVPIVHVVYDFRHRAGKTKKGVVDVCVTYCGKRKYISTGVKVFPSEWDRRDCAVREDAMMPKFMRGDILALAHLPKGAVFPNGSPMVVDTRPFGFVFRRVYDIGDALDCRVANKESGYTDTVMQKSQVIRLYRVVGLLRIGN